MIGNLSQFRMQNSELTQLYTIYTSAHLSEEDESHEEDISTPDLNFSIKKNHKISKLFFLTLF